jgi:acyl carrier protein
MKKKVESIFHLSPQQQGMLFESLAASGSVLHVQQLSFDLDGDLDFTRFSEAWQQVVDRHGILRTAFAWKDQSEPLQVALQGVKLPVELLDWRGRSPEAEEESLEALLAADLERGFDLSKAPSMRITLVRRADNRYRLLWTFHHILMDGWCWPLLLRDFLNLYQTPGDQGRLRLAPARPYSDYIDWLSSQDREAAERFWRETLEGVVVPTALGVAADPELLLGNVAHGSEQARVPAAATAALRTFARQSRLTMNTVVQGIWGLLLSLYSGRDDVVFGVTVSGRPAELENVESMIGLFINTLPLRLRLALDRPFSSWLREIQQQQLGMSRYGHCSEGQIHQWIGMAGTTPLYESILVFENYPLPLSTLRSPELDLTIHSSEFRGSFTKYPVNLLVAETEELLVQLTYDGRRLDSASVLWVLEHWVTLAEGLAADPDQTLESLRNRIPADRIPRIQPAHGRRRRPEAVYLAPRTGTEEILAGLWADVLGVSPVGLDDNFFELGGHSLLALEILNRIRETFGVDFSLRLLFGSPTIAEQAVVVAQSQAGDLDSGLLADLLGKLESMSEEEARLQSRRAPAGGGRHA